MLATPVRPIVSAALSGLLTLSALAAAPRTVAAQVSVDQVEMFLSTATPDRKSGLVNVTNVGDRAFQVQLYLNDWDRSESGEVRFFPTGQIRQSCRDRLQVFPTSVRLEPQSRQAVRVTYTGPDSLASTCWSLLFAEMSDLRPVSGRVVQYVVRAGVKVFVEPRGLARDAAIEDVALTPHVVTDEEKKAGARAGVDSSRRDLQVLFHNLGGMQLRPAGKVEIRRPDNTTVATVAVDEFPVLPGAVRRVSVPMPALAPGKYIAIALLDFGGADIAGGQLEFDRP